MKRESNTEKERKSAKKRGEARNEGGWCAVELLSFSFSCPRKKGSVKYSGREDSRVLRGVLSTLTAVDHA